MVNTNKQLHAGQRMDDSGSVAYVRDVEACKNIFVTWVWLVGIIVVLAGGAWLASATYNKNESSQDALIEKRNDDIIKANESIAAGFEALNKRLDAFEKRNDRRLERIENKLE